MVPLMKKLLIVPGIKYSVSSYLAVIPSFCLANPDLDSELKEEGEIENITEEKDKEKEIYLYDFRKNTFSDVVSQSLEEDILPIGILRKPSEEFDIDKATHSYVVCVPDGTTIIRETDKIYAFVRRDILIKINQAETKINEGNMEIKEISFI